MSSVKRLASFGGSAGRKMARVSDCKKRLVVAAGDFDDVSVSNDESNMMESSNPVSKRLDFSCPSPPSSPDVHKLPQLVVSASPPTQGVQSMHLVEPPPPTSTTRSVSSTTTTSAASATLPRRRLLATMTSSSSSSTPHPSCRSRSRASSVSCKASNLNPFTPVARRASDGNVQRFKDVRLTPSTMIPRPPDLISETPDSPSGLNETSGYVDDYTRITIEEEHFTLPAKRVRVSDLEVSRYDEEFVELREIASGNFGQVKVARHRLDGMLYAIKVTRQPLAGSYEEASAMNEVFAHAALMKHKHIVRYYSCWVERSRLFIQTEYCEGGSLAELIERRRASNSRFSETELKRILSHVCKGLAYLHSNQLVHLDIKPENIFVAIDYESHSSHDQDPNTRAAENYNDYDEFDAKTTPKTTLPKPIPENVVNESTDSGHHSDHLDDMCEVDHHNSGRECSVSFKIGDLGHIVRLHGNCTPEEGDCRYMAPELLAFDTDWNNLAKADIFSLGLTIFECASLMQLPRNSDEDPLFVRLQRGDLPKLNHYSQDFNKLLEQMVQPSPLSRPSSQRLTRLAYLQPCVKKTRSNAELLKQLKSCQSKIEQLEQQIKEYQVIMAIEKKSGKTQRKVGRGTKKAATFCIASSKLSN